MTEKSNDPDEVRRRMRALLRVIEELRGLYPRMELGQLSVLLHVLSDPGVRAGDLTTKVKLKSSALSRNVKALSHLHYLPDETTGDPRSGLGLITQIPDAADNRAYMLSPTKTGRDLSERLSSLMKG